MPLPFCASSPIDPHRKSINKQRILLGLFLLSAATFTFEINLTRLFSVAQFYHFAFMIVSVALLGYGASGTALTIFPGLQRGNPARSLRNLALSTGFSMLIAYLLINWLPFDSYSMLLDRRQVFILILHYIALSAPFFFSGMALGILLARFPAQVGSTYAINLFGSALGCVIALVAPYYTGAEGMVTLSSLLATLAAIVCFLNISRNRISTSLGIFALLMINIIDLSLRLNGQTGLPFLELHISPYKSLSYALQYPSSKVIYHKWNAYSLIDVVRSKGIHSLPGLSYRYMQPLPSMDGLLVDGNDLNPIIQPSADFSFTRYVANAIAFQLRPIASTLVLEPRGGLDVITALALTHGEVTSIEMNPLIAAAVPVYADARLKINVESERSFLQRTQAQYDVIVLSLISSFHPVQSGAYALSEDYRYTKESFQLMLNHLAPDGLLVATRWLQDPPSEDLRLFALAVTAVEDHGADPHTQIVAFRGYNTATVLIKNGVFSPHDLTKIRNFTSKDAFDLTYAPDIQASETNQYNILPESKYYQTYLNLLESNPRQSFYDAYAYDIQPPTDDHPFFDHLFKWSQAPQILAQFGKAWLPFGGGGYFVVLALFILAVLLAAALILLPVLLWNIIKKNIHQPTSPFSMRSLIYFGMLGFAFLFVEIPLLQQFILYLGNPAYAFTMVLFSLLFFSGFGSQSSKRVSLRGSLAVLTIAILVFPWLLPRLFDWTLGLPLIIRLGVTVLSLSPIGFLMGIPFPAGIRLLTQEQATSLEQDKEVTPRLEIPWIWAVNGAASVISPILAALLALSFNFSAVLRIGAFFYAVALFTVWKSLRFAVVQRPAR